MPLSDADANKFSNMRMLILNIFTFFVCSCANLTHKDNVNSIGEMVEEQSNHKIDGILTPYISTAYLDFSNNVTDMSCFDLTITRNQSEIALIFSPKEKVDSIKQSSTNLIIVTTGGNTPCGKAARYVFELNTLNFKKYFFR